ncbi:hypothetical protein Tco_1351364 [Tanacetum coccineum]
MVWTGASLRFEKGEKKLNEVDFISQGVELVSRILATMTKTSEIEDELLEEIEKFGWWFEQDIGGESEDDMEKRLVMVSEEGWMSSIMEVMLESSKSWFK